MDIINEARRLMEDDPDLTLSDALHVIQIVEIREVKRVEGERTTAQTAWHERSNHIIVTFFAAMGQWLSMWNPNKKK